MLRPSRSLAQREYEQAIELVHTLYSGDKKDIRDIVTVLGVPEVMDLLAYERCYVDVPNKRISMSAMNDEFARRKIDLMLHILHAVVS